MLALHRVRVSQKQFTPSSFLFSFCENVVMVSVMSTSNAPWQAQKTRKKNAYEEQIQHFAFESLLLACVCSKLNSMNMRIMSLGLE